MVRLTVYLATALDEDANEALAVRAVGHGDQDLLEGLNDPFIDFLEVFRYPYLGTARAFAWAVCAVVVLLIVHSGRHRREFDTDLTAPRTAQV